jgi:hypothetical protein
MSHQTKIQLFPGGSAVNVDLEGPPIYCNTQITFSGRASGVVTVTAMATGGDAYETVTDAVIDLATKRTLVINGFSVKSLRFSDAGTGAFTATIIQRP